MFKSQVKRELACIRARPREWAVMFKSQAKRVSSHVKEPVKERGLSCLRAMPRE
jgi:hypothetical protein